jgi:predicted TIM-barrel fold metal-dependent hydrolase
MTEKSPDGKVLIVSVDGHVGALDPSEYAPYLDPQYRDRIEDLHAENRFWAQVAPILEPTEEVLACIDDRGAIRSGGVSGGWDVQRRLDELDAEGIAAEVLFPATQASAVPFFAAINDLYPDDLRWAGTRAYHRWLSDFMAATGGRLVGVAHPGSCLDIAAACAELEFVAAHGFVSVGVPGVMRIPTLPPIFTEHFERFWATCDELGLVLSVHAGYGKDQGGDRAYVADLLARNLDYEAFMAEISGPTGPFAPTLKPRRVLWQLMLGGVFDRYPDLRLVFTEIRGDWIPATVAHLDRQFETLAADDRPELRPSEYWARNCAAGVSFIHRAEVEMRHEIGLDRLMFGADYPHPEGTWPNTRDWIRSAFAGTPENDVRAILGENAITWYGLDRDPLASIAERIGPAISDVVDGPAVDRRLLDHFHARGGYGKPVEEIDAVALHDLVQEDFATLGAR